MNFRSSPRDTVPLGRAVVVFLQNLSW